MNYELVYLILNASVMPAWLLLVLAPRADFTRKIVHSGLYPLLLGAFYATCLTLSIGFGIRAEGANFMSLAGVTTLFSHPMGVLIGWSHYLVFDLFVGAWIGRNAIRRGVPHLAVIPCLFFALMFGPIGLLLYLILRLTLGKGSFTLWEDKVASRA